MAKAKSKAKATKKPIVKAKTKKPAAKPAMKAQSKKPAKAKAAAKSKTQNKKSVKTQTSAASSGKSQPPAKVVSSSAQAKTKFVDVSEFVTPLDDRVIVQVLEGEKVTAGGIIIPDTVTGLVGNRRGVVLSVGRGHRDPKGRVRPMDVQKGDRIVFPDFTGSKISYQGQDLVILRETDVMGVLD